jgi:hypothetical protein
MLTAYFVVNGGSNLRINFSEWAALSL